MTQHHAISPRMTRWTVIGLLLAAFACKNDANSSGCGSTAGDAAVMRFSYTANTTECTGVCDITIPLMVGGTASMRATADIDRRDFSVSSADPNIAEFSFNSEEHYCITKQTNPDGTKTDLPRAVGSEERCNGAEIPRVIVRFTAAAKRGGGTKVNVLAQNAKVDSLTIPTAEARAITAPVGITVAVGAKQNIALTVKGDLDRNLVPGNSITAIAANNAIATVARLNDEAQTDFEVTGVDVGTTQVTFRAGTAQTSVQVTVAAP